MNRVFYSLLVSLFFVISAAIGAEAIKATKEKNAPTATAQPQGVCQKDAEKHCSGFGMHDGLSQCLSDHKTELSDVCAASLKPLKK